jgi:hypothetical protein
MRYRLLMLALSLATFVGLPDSRAAEPPADGSALEHAVLAGKDIHVVLDLARCTEPDTGKAGPAIRGSLHPDGFMVQQDHGVAFAVSHFTVRPDKTPVTEFMSFRVKPDGKVALHSTFLNASSYAVLREAEFECDTGAGVTFIW